ncbi:addiction module toxin, Txe/YoeB family [Paucilactobacillus hokkaidonensis JCM 18461]|uniref:Endoribonuclease YoeB n=1 Tax=Paucilactobacillus hokkaidonensis JCM 18461 TaxID=1291742 RepID=A0A0A1GV59_9LACO|nr:addiction module toxin, Txe/YoeB family [Paucilactobacillus hokkaidonensis JCM 18461]
MTWIIMIKPAAEHDLKNILKSPLRSSFQEILTTLESNPYEPTQQFEKLTPLASQLYSRRLNGQHRVVYTIDKETKIVRIISAWSHYEQK